VLGSQLARGSGSELVLVCAYPCDEFPSRGASTGYKQFLREDAEDAIRRAQEGISDLPQITSYVVAELSPAKCIESVAVREHASLIVIGSSHRSAVDRLLAGTTAERLLHGAPCPVAVAPNGWHSREAGAIRSIAVAYDQSDEAKAALAGAAAMARALGAHLRVIEVLEELKLGTSALMAGPGHDIRSGNLKSACASTSRGSSRSYPRRSPSIRS